MNFKIYLIHHLKQWPTGRKIGEGKNRFLEDTVFLKVLRRQCIKNCFFCSSFSECIAFYVKQIY